ncbi:MAG: NfeD protein [Dehalococcoidia bacterium]|nr:NfeD protein [Dehalococcoidia bacterium]
MSKEKGIMTREGHSGEMGKHTPLSRRLLRSFMLALSVLAVSAGLAGFALGQGGHAILIDIDDVINPVTAGFLHRAVDRAEKDEAELLIVRLDTPGGLFSSTRDMVSDLLEAEVPSVVYVAPGGAHAASAGTFIAAAANFAVMAPGTNIGAASPVGAGGEDLPETLASKATQDAAALMRDIAAKRGRNSEKLEETVLKATAYSSEEAVELKVVDFIALNLDDLLQKLDGQTVETAAGPRTLHTEGLQVRTLGMSFTERFLLIISDPNIAFILLVVGGLGIVIELFSPGAIVPGVVGAISLLLAFVALGNLPVNWAGVTFILLAMALLFLEAQVAGFGILGVGAIISFVVGGLLLFYRSGDPSPTMPTMGVSLWVLLPTTAILVGGGSWVVMAMIKSRRAVTFSTAETVMGKVGTVTTDLAPIGTVQLTSELWTAVADNEEVIRAGEKVRVVGLEGLTIRVSKTRE